MSERKLCIDCRYFFMAVCTNTPRLLVPEIDEYTGIPTLGNWRSCADYRRSTEEGACGPDAKFWEAK